MRTLKIIALLLAFYPSFSQSQKTVTSSDQERTIEVNNSNGDLFISFLNGEITEFSINGESISLDDYGNYQSIIDDFTQEEVPYSSQDDETEEEDDDQPQTLRTAMSEYLYGEGKIKSLNKFNIQLEKDFLKVGGKTLSDGDHQACLDIFEEVYGKKMNRHTQVSFKKSGNKSRSSIQIRE